MLTRQWWSTRRAFFDLYVSDFVIDEAACGDPVAAAERLKELDSIPRLKTNQVATDLAQRLAMTLRLPARARVDAAHVAMAAVYDVTFLLTWNCTHLANGVLAHRIEATCGEAGFKAPRILTPELLMDLP